MTAQGGTGDWATDAGDDADIIALVYEIGGRNESTQDRTGRAITRAELDDRAHVSEDAARTAYRQRIQRRNQNRGGARS